MSTTLLSDNFNSALNVSNWVLCGDTTSFQSYSNQISVLTASNVSLSNDIVLLTNQVNNLNVGMNVSYGNFTKYTGDTSGSAVYSHNLGVIPEWIEFIGNNGSEVTGYYDVINNTNYVGIKAGQVVTTFYYQEGLVTNATSSNFTINWSRGGSTSPQTISIMFKVTG